LVKREGNNADYWEKDQIEECYPRKEPERGGRTKEDMGSSLEEFGKKIRGGKGDSAKGALETGSENGGGDSKGFLPHYKWCSNKKR